MTRTSRRKRPLDREKHPLRDSRLVVIATEGERTEPRYFRAFERVDSRVQVEVLETIDGESAPKHVLERLRNYKRDHQIGKGDALFLVIDEDRWPSKQLSQVASEARKLRCGFAVSCPCFDVWLYLHHADPPTEMAQMSSQDVKAALRGLLGGYNPSNFNPDDFLPTLDDAIDRARSLDDDVSMRWPKRPGSRVYLVIESICEKGS